MLLLADPKLDWAQRAAAWRPAAAAAGVRRHRPAGALGLAAQRARARWPGVSRQWRAEILAASPGKLASERCDILGGGFVARCRIGAGAATVIADADFLNVEGEGALDGPTDHNLDLLIAELAASRNPLGPRESRDFTNNLIHRLVQQEQAWNKW